MYSFKIKNRNTSESFIAKTGSSLIASINEMVTGSTNTETSAPASPKSCPNMNIFDNSCWCLIPEEVLLNVLYYLKPRDVLNAGTCCKRWNSISRDDYLWKKMFHRDFKIDKNIAIKPGADTWYSEYKRLTDNVPMVLTEVLVSHSHQVLHVSFSHNGKMFATCSKDGLVIIWNATYPATIKYSHDMKNLCWKYTQYSQFNQTDQLLLVSGVHFGSPNSTSGEIAVFSVQNGSRLRCRVANRPYDIFGTWFTEQHLISGDLNWLAHLVSSSMLWLNKANQEINSEHVPIMNQLYKFYNRNASSIRAIMIANCPWLEDETHSQIVEDPEAPSTSAGCQSANEDRCSGNPPSQLNPSSSNSNPGSSNYTPFPYREFDNQDYATPINYSDEFRREFEDNFYDSDDDDCFDDDDDEEDDEDNANGNDYGDENDPLYERDHDSMDDDVSDFDELENLCPKYLIFSTGSKTYTPHQIGFKRIDKVNFPRRLDPGLSIKERIALRNRKKELEVIMQSLGGEELRLQSVFQNEQRDEPNWNDYDSVAKRFDTVDKLIDLHGHIIGMGLSPDHRYLYVNSRPWPQNYVIRNPLEPPPIAQEIDIHVIDLTTLREVGTMLRAHKAYTPNTECFFIFLDVCDNYVASGAEDMHAYLWDRYYGVCLAKYQHQDVVNSVAFNPKDNEMLITTSDDYEIKIWRSVSKTKALGIKPIGSAIDFRTKKK